MNNLFKEIDAIFDRYDQKRVLASEILDREGMEEAIIDELAARGYAITQDEYAE